MLLTLIKEYNSPPKNNNANRIRDAKREGEKVVDVDGSYLARKYQQLQMAGVNVAPLGLPPIPTPNWLESCDGDQLQESCRRNAKNDVR